MKSVKKALISQGEGMYSFWKKVLAVQARR